MQMHKNKIRNTKKTKQKQYALTITTKQQNKMSTVTKRPYAENMYKLSEECHKLMRNRL
jgi:hypothetical protein